MKSPGLPGTLKSRRWLSSEMALLGGLAALYTLLHLLVNGQYGYFRDELAYRDDAQHLDWGYVDHPPVAPFIGSLSRFFFQDALVAFRLGPTLAIAATLIVSGLIARELGGGRLAQFVTVLGLFISPVYLLFGVLFQAAAFEQLFWAIICLLTVRMINTDNPKLWLAIGLVIGLSAMNKYSVVFFVVGLGIALLLTPLRRHLLTPWPWLGALIALIIFLPNLLWLVNHDFISLTYTRDINARDVSIGRADGFLVEQFYQITNPVSLPLWLAGLYFLLFKQKQYRLLGFVYIIVLVLLLVLHGRSYYLMPAYPALFAAGGVMLEGWLSSGPRVKWAYLGLLVAGGLLVSSLGLPLLPAGSDLWRTVVKVNSSYPEMVGWEDLTSTVAQVYESLPPSERADTLIFAGNYGEAGAMSLYGPKVGLPATISPVNTYYYWSQNNLKASTYIVLGYTGRQLAYLQTRWVDVQPVVTSITNRYSIENEETHYQIYLCRRPKVPMNELWPQLQHFG